MEKKSTEKKPGKKEPMKIFPCYLENDMRAEALEKSTIEGKTLAAVIRELLRKWLGTK